LSRRDRPARSRARGAGGRGGRDRRRRGRPGAQPRSRERQRRRAARRRPRAAAGLERLGLQDQRLPLHQVVRPLLAVVPGLARLRPPVQRSAATQEPDEPVRRPFRAGVLGGTAPRDAGGAHRSPQPTQARARWIAVVRHCRAARLLRRRQPIRPRARLAEALRPPTGRTTAGWLVASSATASPTGSSWPWPSASNASSMSMHIGRQIIYWLLVFGGLAWLSARLNRRKILVLVYHGVHSGHADPVLNFDGMH